MSAALAEQGYKVMQFGCDPKADSTNTLLNGKHIPTILETVLEGATVREFKHVDASKVLFKGYGGVVCAESGGPSPGIGCAGRGIITAVELMKSQGVFEEIDPDFIFYDVLGDVVCGGFAMPIREGIAEQIYVVTSSTFASLYAANNIFLGVLRYARRGGAKVAGLIANYIDTPEQKRVVDEFASLTKTEVVDYIPYSEEMILGDLQGKTVIESSPDSEAAALLRKLASKIAERDVAIIPEPVVPSELRKRGASWLTRTSKSQKE